MKKYPLLPLLLILVAAGLPRFGGTPKPGLAVWDELRRLP